MYITTVLATAQPHQPQNKSKYTPHAYTYTYIYFRVLTSGITRSIVETQEEHLSLVRVMSQVNVTRDEHATSASSDFSPPGPCYPKLFRGYSALIVIVIILQCSTTM